MRVLAIFITLLLSGLLWADECDRLPKPTVTLKRIDEHVTVDTNYSYKELARMASPLAKPGTRLLGLTRGKATVQFAISVPALVEQGGHWLCASPQVVVTFGLRPMTVYIAKEVPAGSCAFDEIYRHELRHVRAYQEHLARIEGTLERTLLRRFGTESPWRNPPTDTRTQLAREMKERWLPYVRDEINRGEADQELIDTPEEYARVADSCNGEVKKLGF